MTKPDFIIIGAMKCGTSTLHSQLTEQDGFFMSEPKEPNYFSDDDVFAKGAEWYEGLFADALPGAIKGESSTHYTKQLTHPKTIERLRLALPEVKLIYLMRHPIDRLVSHFIHEWTMGEVSGDISEAAHPDSAFVDYSLYAKQLKPFIDHYGRESILPIFLERMQLEPSAELQRAAAFVGAVGEVRWAADHGAQNVSSERIRRFPLYGLLVENPVATFLRRNLIPQSLRDHVKHKFQMKKRPELSKERVGELTEIFDADLTELGDWLGTSLSCENFKEVVKAEPLNWSAH